MSKRFVYLGDWTHKLADGKVVSEVTFQSPGHCRWCSLQCSHMNGWEGVEILSGEDIKEVGNPGYWKGYLVTSKWMVTEIVWRTKLWPVHFSKWRTDLGIMIGTLEKWQGFYSVFSFLTRGHIWFQSDRGEWGTSVPSGFKINVPERALSFEKSLE